MSGRITKLISKTIGAFLTSSTSIESLYLYLPKDPRIIRINVEIKKKRILKPIFQFHLLDWDFPLDVLFPVIFSYIFKHFVIFSN